MNAVTVTTAEWNHVGTEMGYTDTPAKRQAITAAADAIDWTDQPSAPSAPVWMRLWPRLATVSSACATLAGMSSWPARSEHTTLTAFASPGVIRAMRLI
jgi:hypothetical protein